MLTPTWMRKKKKRTIALIFLFPFPPDTSLRPTRQKTNVFAQHGPAEKANIEQDISPKKRLGKNIKE